MSYALRIMLALLSLSSCVAPCMAQEPVPVRLEPRHHNVFENQWVRILDVRIPPKDTSLMHKHETPSVFIVLGNTKTGSQVLVEPAHAQFSHEDIWFESFATSPRIHRVWNSDTSVFHTIDMEILDKHPRTIDPPLTMPALSLLFDETPVRGYHVKLGAHTGLSVPPRKAPVVVVALDQPAAGMTVNQKTFVGKGDYLFVPPGTDLKFSAGEHAEQFAIFEIK